MTAVDFDIQRCTRRCAKTDRELKAGESFYSALVSQGAEVVRVDFSVDAWEGPPPDAMCWWKSQMPHPHARKLHWAPNDVILHFFLGLEHQPDQLDTRYVLALLMIRRRIVRLEEMESDDSGAQTLILHCPRNEEEYKVTVMPPSQQRATQIQQELSKLLFAKGA